MPVSFTEKDFSATLFIMGPVGVVYSALQFDEFGNLAPAFSRSFTATSLNGELNVSDDNTDCGQWMLDTLVLVAHGAVDRTTVSSFRQSMLP